MAEDKDEQQERGFKVEDRRRFTADGKPREEVDAAEETQSEPPPAGAAGGAAAGGRAGAAPEQASAPRDPGAASPQAGAGAQGATAGAQGRSGSGAPPEELTFSSFVVGIASQAFAFLGAVPDPRTGVVRKDLGQAKAMIDILALLAEKTAGNLDEQEARLMEEMLYELRMQYVRELRGQIPGGGKSE